jgi:seryl-tRNA synthetase
VCVQDSELPRKYMALTRCYRSEAHEQGMYRVHEFDKLEMFAVTAGDVRESSAMLEHFVTLQRRLYDSLQLHFRYAVVPNHPSFSLHAFM